MKKAIKFSQSIGTSAIIINANINGLPVERFMIKEAIGAGFYITSDKGLDGRDNDSYFQEIEKAIKWIKDLAKNNREY